ncbi:MAG: PatB family C-S lyase [Bacteroidales bacterium]|nr:PatB family C-S lyase [Bacteroidales bacterium]
MKKTYSFDEIINRKGSNCVKYDLLDKLYGDSDLLPMWVADMDFKTPDFIIQAIEDRLKHPILGYSIRPEYFTESVVQWMKKRHNYSIDPEWVVFTPGIVPALNIAVLSLTQAGEEIIVQPPVYFPFFSAVTDHGRIMSENQLKTENGEMKINFGSLNKNAKMLLLSSPHNPGGMIWSKKDLKKLAEFCLTNNITIVSDEIHSDLMLFGNKHLPTASISPEIENITITCIAPSKTFNIAGLSSSVVIISNREMREKFTKTLNSLHIGMGNIFGNVALEAAYTKGEQWLAELIDYLEENINFAINFFEAKIPQIKVIKPQATYMLWLDCRGLGMSNKDMRKFFTDNCNLALSDGRQFGRGGEGFQRLNLACPKSILETALESIYNNLKQK